MITDKLNRSLRFETVLQEKVNKMMMSPVAALMISQIMVRAKAMTLSSIQLVPHHHQRHRANLNEAVLLSSVSCHH